MAAARRLVGLGRAARTDAAVKVRQPLRRALLLHPGIRLGDEVRAEVADELNVQGLEEIDALSGLVRWQVVPNFRALGPRLGAQVNRVKTALAQADGTELRDALERDGSVEVAGVRLEAHEVEVRAERQLDIALAQDGAWAVALDLELDEPLRLEGTARELVRALNDLRRELGFAIADRVDITLASGDARLVDSVEAHSGWIAGEVLAGRLTLVPELDPAGEAPARLIIEGATLAVRLRRA